MASPASSAAAKLGIPPETSLVQMIALQPPQQQTQQQQRPLEPMDGPEPLRDWLRARPLWARELIAGGVAGGVAKSLVAPLERAKILLQTRRAQQGIPGTLMHIWNTEGLSGLWRGNSASVLRIVPYAAIHFGVYEQYRRFIVESILHVPPRQHIHPLWDLVAGSAAGATAVLFTYPLDLVRTRMAWATDAPTIPAPPPPQPSNSPAATPNSAAPVSHPSPSQSTPHLSSVPGPHSSPLPHPPLLPLHHTSHSPVPPVLPRPGWKGRPSLRSTLMDIVKEGGVLGLYRGISPTMLGILPYAGIKFYVYQSMKKWHRENHQKSSSALAGGKEAHLPVHLMLAFGGAAGLVAQTLTYPLDVVRRRMQVEGSPGGAPALQAAPSTTMSTARSVLQAEGWRGLFRGLSVNYMKVVPSTAIGFTLYDTAKQYLDIQGNL